MKIRTIVFISSGLDLIALIQDLIEKNYKAYWSWNLYSKFSKKDFSQELDFVVTILSK